jgi:hypothetical protein
LCIICGICCVGSVCSLIAYNNVYCRRFSHTKRS